MSGRCPSGYLVVANHDAGSAMRDRVEAAARRLIESGDVETVWTRSPGQLQSAVERVDGRTLVIAGGDGTIHLVVNQLDRMGLLDSVPIGILPLGTGNDLARGLDLPLDPVEAAQRIVDGRPRSAALLRLGDGELATNNAHLGLGVAAAKRASSLKPKLGPLAYTVGGIIAGVRHAPTSVVVEVDGRLLHDGPVTAVIVALGPSAGGGHELSDDITLFEPAVDVFALAGTGPADRLRLLPHLVRNDLRNAGSVRSDRGSNVTIDLEHETTAEIDGEFRRWSGTVALSVQADAWHVVS